MQNYRHRVPTIDLGLPAWIRFGLGLLVLLPLAGMASGLGSGTLSAALSPSIDPSPANGMLLIARRGMPDPRFRRTVILLAKHDAGGSLGLILNRRSKAQLGMLVPELEGADRTGHRIYIGGPVHMDRLLFLVRHPTQPGHAINVMHDLYLSGDLGTLEGMLQEGKTKDEMHIYLGYSGWGAGQLAGELERRDWHLRAGSLDDVFADEPEQMWGEMIQFFEPEGLPVRTSPPATGKQHAQISILQTTDPPDDSHRRAELEL